MEKTRVRAYKRIADAKSKKIKLCDIRIARIINQSPVTSVEHFFIWPRRIALLDAALISRIATTVRRDCACRIHAHFTDRWKIYPDGERPARENSLL